ncbi:MAG: hypothetical protein AB1941_09960 [Gemmatimonadota bacterium]
MPQTLEEQLERVQAAIAEVETGGQERAFANGRSRTQADIRALYKRETELKTAIARRNRRRDEGGIRIRRGFVG